MRHAGHFSALVWVCASALWIAAPAASGSPVVQIVGPNPLTAEATSPSGALVNFATPNVFDTVPQRTIVSVTYTKVSGSTFPLGGNADVIKATNDFGETAQSTLTINVVDTTPPSLTVPSDQ